MARQTRRTRPGDAANLFIRCFLADAGKLLGGLTEEEWHHTLDYFEFRCAYTDQQLTLETAVKDHAIPINQAHCGLHLYGNVLPCCNEANKDKHHVHYRQYVEDVARLAKIEAFVAMTGYEERVKRLGDLRDYCATQYDMITSLSACNYDYLERVLGVDSAVTRTPPEDGLGEAAVTCASKTPKVVGRGGVLPITLDPSPSVLFKKALLIARQAWITIHYADGSTRMTRWKADNITETTNIKGNLRSRPEFRQGKWQQLGIERVSISISQPTA